MRTSNFATCAQHPDAVSIAGWPPPWFVGRKFKLLAPTRQILDDYKRSGDSNVFTRRFYEDVLSKLNAQRVFDQLGEHAILICYEKPCDFCHRRLVARWLETELGIAVPEYVEQHSIL